jgi:hypothetical protein
MEVTWEKAALVHFKFVIPKFYLRYWREAVLFMTSILLKTVLTLSSTVQDPNTDTDLQVLTDLGALA